MNNMTPLTRGIAVFIALAVLSVIEYIVGVYEGMVVLLVIFAILKAGLVLWFFMHLPRVFKSGEGDH